MLKGFLAAVASAFVLIALFACSACYDGGDFSKREYCFKGVQSIRIEAADRTVNVERCAADGVRVECFESETEYYSAAQEGGSLTIELVRDKEWTDFIGTQPNAKWRVVTVYVPETRPYLQGARLTEPSLRAMGIRCFLITDAMGAHFMAEGKIDRFMTASDLVLSDRTVVNKTGTLSDAIAASFYGIPYYAFSLSIDREARRDAIIMESREGWGEPGSGARMLYPLFDMIPPELVTGIITKDGVI